MERERGNGIGLLHRIEFRSSNKILASKSALEQGKYVFL